MSSIQRMQKFLSYTVHHFITKHNTLSLFVEFYENLSTERVYIRICRPESRDADYGYFSCSKNKRYFVHYGDTDYNRAKGEYERIVRTSRLMRRYVADTAVVPFTFLTPEQYRIYWVFWGLVTSKGKHLDDFYLITSLSFKENRLEFTITSGV